ncbi:MAG: tRNA (adenosine(37)-N6)-dimethylallyltransferase MiaA [Phycisphaerales bacterium]
MALTQPTPRIVVVLGPTAGGKSELAVALAERFAGEVINADSMQVYRHLDAGTAKPSRELMRRVPHHLIDVAEPTDTWTVADWLDAAERCIADLHQRGKLPIVVGGTNLYLKALLEGFFDGPPADEAFRATLTNITPQQLHERLKRIDPPAAERIHPNDHKRLVRALEVHHQTGKPISAQQQQWSDGAFSTAGAINCPRRQPTGDGGLSYLHNPVLIGLDWPAAVINPRINARVKLMFHPTDGGEDLVSETRRLRDAGLLGVQAAKALGYQQVLAALAGHLTMDEAFEKTKIETRRFAKAQRTWLKRYRGVHWLPAAELPAENLADAATCVVASETAR